MNGSRQRDFTQGSIPRHLLLFSLPMLAGNLLQSMLNVVDSIWVGRFVGPEALGTVSVSFPLIFALLSLVMGITMATSTLVAQYRGAGDEDMVQRTVGTSMVILAIGGLLCAAVGILFRYPLLRLIQTPEAILDQSASYFGIFMAGVPTMFLYFTVAAILRGLGDSATALRYMAIMTVVNIVLDPLLIIGVGPFPAMGVAGAALATVVAQGLASFLIVRWAVKNTGMIRLERSFWQVDPAIIKLLFKIGLPAGLQQMLVSLSMLAVTALVNGYGPAVVAAFGAASRLDNLAFLPSMSMSMAVAAMVGQNIGAGKWDRVSGIVRWSCALAATITGSVGLLAILQPELLIKLFTTDAAVVSTGGQYLRTIGWIYVPMALMMILGGVMRGAGDTMAAMLFTVGTMWLFRVPLSLLLSRYFGTQGIWWGIALSTVLGLAFYWVYYLSGRWKRQLVRRRVEPAMAPVSGD